MSVKHKDLSFSLPKYSRYELREMILQTEKPVLSSEDEVIYNQLIGRTLLKDKHYQLASKILGIPKNEILQRENETAKEKIFYRSNNQAFDDEIHSIINLFRCFSEQKKLRGLSHE
ncbi:hypothetical protein [Macrococcus bovicus]|uniref:hypothetical protein n=1 Tax=Macrococcus bovicus TaxID=69968 RepID=UPI0025A50108|nr:hypothetical protein [Macrococcus bovicus]WJP97782.1 hypothetical protein QSV55_11265 [Macrococcus bovicus]